MKVRSLILLLSSLSLALSACQPSGPETKIQTYLDDMAANGFFSGVVLITYDDEPILEKAYGMANLGEEIPNTMETKFNLGSMNKMFTAVAILQLVEAGGLSLEDTIADVLPDYSNQDVAARVTIHHLLTHTSGMGDIFNLEYIETPKDRFRTLADYLPLFIDQPLHFEPGSQAAYSNAGYLVLGLIIEQASGMSYYEYVAQNIFQPCGMIDSGYYQIDEIVENLAVGYTHQIEGVEGLSSNVTFLPGRGSSAGGGYATAGDLLRFSACLMGNQLLSDERTNLMLQPMALLDAAGLSFNYGYGFMILDVNGQIIIGHSGGAPGICSTLDIYPTLGYTVVVLTNSDDDCRPIRLEIRRILTE